MPMTFFPNPVRRAFSDDDRKLVSCAHADQARGALQLCPRHAETPLPSLPEFARRCGVGAIHIKAEWDRMGLGSFKALGGGLAVKLRAADHETFVCASAGNHGLAVAAAARAFGRRAVVYLSHGVPSYFAERLAAEGAIVRRAGLTYEDSLVAAARAARRHDWALIADSSRRGYVDPVLDIMRGYAVLFAEAADTLELTGRRPSHVFLQAGVGGLAAAGAAYLRDRWNEALQIVVVEPIGAPCLFESAIAGRPVCTHAPGSGLGRLNCAAPSLVAFDLLHALADAFILVSDEEAQAASVQLQAEGASTSACGAAGAAGLLAASQAPAVASRLGLGPDAHVLLVGTEAHIPPAKEPP